MVKILLKMETIKEILKSFSEKVSSYQIFTFLFPGAVFLAVLSNVYSKTVPETSIWEKLFLCYTVGMIISRIGTLLLEEFLFWLSNLCGHFLVRIDYRKIILAERKDAKVNMLLQVSNTYRTMAAVFLTLLIVAAVNKFTSLDLQFSSGVIWFSVIMVLLFTLSFIKQYDYAEKRVEFVSSEV